MNKIDTLPKAILKDDIVYGLAMHTTAWNKLCLCYKSMFSLGDYIFSQVVEPSFTFVNNTTEFSEQMNDIIDVPDFDAAVSMLEKRVNYALEHNQVTIYE